LSHDLVSVVKLADYRVEAFKRVKNSLRILLKLVSDMQSDGLDRRRWIYRPCRDEHTPIDDEQVLHIVTSA
tara:strand:+ start:617 stop:829 length:213 start_codon:yes stop_codon:yes gene_type:complete